jgi:hypothetical protein
MIKIAVPALVAAAMIAATGPADGATTIGSDLSRTATGGYCVGDGPGSRCTELQLALGTTDQAVPADGILTRWAVRDAGGELALRIIEGPAGARRVVAALPPVVAVGAGVQSFPAQVAVHAGQRVGVEIGEDGYVPFLYRDEQTTGEEFVPALGADPTAAVPDTALSRTYELLLQATIEPDRDGDGLGDESQDPDHGGLPPCPTAGVLARGADTVIARQGTTVLACRAGVRSTIGSTGVRTRLRLFQVNGDYVAYVKVRSSGSTIEIYNLAERRRTFSTDRTRAGGSATEWTVRDLVVAPEGQAAWIATRRGHPESTSVWVRSGSRVQRIDQGRIRPTSLTLADDASGINYTGADESNRNSGFD